MKYRVDIVLTSRKDFEQKFIKEDFDDRIKAEEKRKEILNTIPNGFYASWNKCFPVIICDCGEEVECINFTNTCECGRDYNFAGSLLASREQWGCETGENWQDCY